MRIASILLLCGLQIQLVAADHPKIAEVVRDKPGEWQEFSVAVGRQLILDAKSPSQWGLMDDEAADLTPVEGGAKAAFSAPKAGRFRVAVAVGESLVRIVIVVGNAPSPPKPPTPPVPPGPDPKPPEPPSPADPLAKELAALYTAETSPTKKSDMQALSALYSLMVTETANPTYSSAAQLNATFVDARDRMLSDGKGGAARLAPLRKRCGIEVAAVIGDNPDAALTDGSRKAVAAVYQRLASAVNEASK